MRYGKDTKEQAYKLMERFDHAGVREFQSATWYEERRTLDVCRMVHLAKRLHHIAEHECNGTATKRHEALERTAEAEIATIAASLGLTATFDGDPRGYVVKLHSPNHDVYNTWGGAESGYGIG